MAAERQAHCSLGVFDWICLAGGTEATAPGALVRSWIEMDLLY